MVRDETYENWLALKCRLHLLTWLPYYYKHTTTAIAGTGHDGLTDEYSSRTTYTRCLDAKVTVGCNQDSDHVQVK